MADNQYLLPLPLQVDPKVAFPRKSQPKVSNSFHHYYVVVVLVVSPLVFGGCFCVVAFPHHVLSVGVSLSRLMIAILGTRRVREVWVCIYLQKQDVYSSDSTHCSSHARGMLRKRSETLNVAG